MPAASQPQHIARFVRNFVRKLRDAGIPEPAAENIGEEMEKVVVRQELDGLATKSDIKILELRMNEMEKRLEIKIELAVSQAVKQIMLWMAALQTLGIAIITLLVR